MNKSSNELRFLKLLGLEMSFTSAITTLIIGLFSLYSFVFILIQRPVRTSDVIWVLTFFVTGIVGFFLGMTTLRRIKSTTNRLVAKSITIAGIIMCIPAIASIIMLAGVVIFRAIKSLFI